MRSRILLCLFLSGLVPSALLVTGAGQTEGISLVLEGGRKFQKIDGFGANLNPDQWRQGHLKTAFDLLTDDLGGALFRFDCFGTADWLDPARRDADGHFPEAYLKEVYTGGDFRGAWEALRYLTSKNARVFLNVSGRIPAALAGPDGQTLKDYPGYAEMVVSHLRWAREKENLKIDLLSPYNETDLGFPEGPKIAPDQCVAVTRAILKRLDESGMSVVKLILMDDDGRGSEDYIGQIVKSSDLAPRMVAFATHTYGDRNEEDIGSSSREPSRFARSVRLLQGSPFQALPLWLGEYGDLDQSGLIEFAVGWRSTRRLLRALQDGVTAGLIWDGYDNFHKHDAAWSTYGLLKTDRTGWTYSPKSRFYAAKQVYRFVRPGFQRVELRSPDLDPTDAYAEPKSPMRHVLVVAFLSPDGQDCTIVGMNGIERDAQLTVSLTGIPDSLKKKPWNFYRTSRTENCLKVNEVQASGGFLSVPLKEKSIFTLTTLSK